MGEGDRKLLLRSRLIRVIPTVVLALTLLACSSLPSVGPIGQGGGKPIEQVVPQDQGKPLTNSDWDAVSRNPDQYRGRKVEITGTVFNLLGTYEGGYHLQIFTDPAASSGNTHLVFKTDPKLKVGFEIRLQGTVKGTLVTSSTSGQELKLPEVAVDSFQIIGPPSAVATPVPSATATTTPVPTKTPTSTNTPATSPTITSTAAVTATSAASATPTKAPVAQRTETPVLESPSATATASSRAAESTPATSTPVATIGSGVPGELRVAAASGSIAAPMAVVKDPSAISGSYLVTTETDQSWDGSGTPPTNTGSATITVQVPKDGTYIVWTRMYYDNLQGNSYWLVVDNGQSFKVGNEDAGYHAWKWVDWSDGNTTQTIKVKLKAGKHTLTLVGREAGARIDTIILTEDPKYVPSG